MLEQNEYRRDIIGKTSLSLKRIASGSKWKMPVEAFRLAREYRRQINEHKNAPWLIIILVSACVDFLGDAIFMGYFIKPFLFFALWGKGAWKAKIFIRFLLFMELVPGLNLLPLQTLAAVYAWKHTAQRANEAEKKLAKIKKNI